MGSLAYFPATDAAFARLTERQRAANIAEERAEAVEDARAVLKSPKRHSDQILRDACAVLQAWGDGHDYLTADARIFALNRKEFIARNCPRPETSRDVLMGMRDRWGEILLCAGIGGVVLLKLTGWL